MPIALAGAMICPEAQVHVTELEDIDALVAQYWPRIFRYVMLAIKDVDMAESITQDCFLKAYRARDSFRGDAAVSTWLFSIANNLIRDQMRLKKVQFWRKASASSIDATEFASVIPSGEVSPERRMLAEERARLVTEALETLSANQRRVFTLRFFEEMSLDEIAAATGMPINTIKVHLHRGVTAIRGKLRSGS